MIKELDEAHADVTLETFDFIKAMNMMLSFDDLQWGLRNLKIPFMQITDFKLKTLFIEGLLNHPDDSDFILRYQEKIFEKYSLPSKLRKLIPKSFYNAEITSANTCFNVQGFDTLMIMYDLNWFFNRFKFADLSDSFPKDYRIKLGFTPLDLLRYRYHGKLNVNMKKTEVNVYKERNFQRQDMRFRMTINKIEFFQNINYLETVIKNINIAKESMTDSETQLLRIPLIETILRFQYNKEDINNHYRDTGWATMEEYMDNIKNYSTHNIAIEIMLHVPSLRNKDVLEAIDSRQLLPYFIKQSHVPVFHFQKSYMAQIYDFMCEYVFKKDYSVKTNVTQYPINYNIIGKVLVSDLIAIFSAFDEQSYIVNNYANSMKAAQEGEFKRQNSRNITSQEQYLDIYEGLIVSLENFFVMNNMEIIHMKDYKTERMKFKVGDAESRCE